jgi:hypothetical protein
MPSMANAAALIAAHASKGSNAAAEALLFRQLAQTTLSIVRAAQAAGDARRAAELATSMREQLRGVRDAYAAQERSNQVATLSPQDRAVFERAEVAAGRGGPLPARLVPTGSTLPSDLAGAPPAPAAPRRRDEAER